MARVPTTAGGFVDRRGGAMPAIQAPDATAGWRQVGEGVRQLGGALAQQAEADDAIDAARDEAAARMVDTEYSDWSRDRLFTGKDAFYSKEGFAADAARGDLEAAIDKQREDYLARASNPRQRELMTRALERRISADKEGIGRYSVQQYRVEERRQSEARLGAASNDALTYFEDPVRFADELLVGESEIRNSGAKAGQAQETTDLQVEQWRSKVYGGVGEKLIRQGRIDDAVSWTEQARAYMLPEQEDALDAALYRPLLDRKIDGLADSVMAGVDPVTVDQAEKDGTNDVAPVVVPRRQGFDIGSPVKGGRITSPYGARAAPTAGASTNHGGVDIAAPKGSPIVAQAAGRVISAQSEGNSGNVVRIDYGGGVVVSYAHMDGFNVKPGQVVKPGAQLGRVGSTGRSTGPHVHMTVRVNGERVDPSKFNGQIGGSISASGTGANPEARAQRHDLGTLLARVDAMNLPFEEEKALKQEIERRVSTDEALRRRAQDDAAERANEILDQAEAAGRPITKDSQIPADVWGAMDPSSRLTLRGVIARNAKPQDRETQPGRYTELSDLYATDPAAFAKIDPLTYRNSLSDSDYKQVLGWRRDVLKGDTGSDKQVGLARIKSITSQVRMMSGLTTNGIPTGQPAKRQAMEKRIFDLEQAVVRDVEIWQRANPGKIVPDDVILQSARRQMTETRNKDEGRADLNDRRYWFERTPGQQYTVNIPTADYNRIRNAGRKLLGRDPTPAEISEVWQREARGGR